MRKYLILGLIGLVAFILAACGSDPTAVPAQAAAQPAATQAPAAQAAAQPAAPATSEKFSFQHACINRTLNPCKIMMEFAANVLERTNGQVEIEISSFPELGLAGPDTLRLLQDGTMDMGEIYGGYVSGDFPAVEMAELLGLFESSAMQEEVFRAIREDEIKMVAEQWDAKVISYVYYPDQFFWSKRPLRTLEDFKGLKARTHSTALGDLVSGLGGEGQFVAFSEVYTALERGILDAGVTGSTPGFSQKWYEVSDYIVGPLTSHPHVMIGINQKLWDSMPGEFQQIILEEAAKAEAKNLRDVAGWDQEGVDSSVAEGMEYIAFTPEVQAGVRRAVLEQIVPNWAARAGGFGSDEVNLFNEKVAPIVGVKILPDGTAQATGPAMATAGRTQLVTTGQKFEFQHACINRSLLPCVHTQDLLDEIRERTDGQVDIVMTSYPELGVGGTDMVRLVEDGTVGFGEIYSGFVGGEFPIFDVINLWGAFKDQEKYMAASDAVRDDMVRIVRRETNGGEVIGFNFYTINFYFTKKPLNTLDDVKGLKTRVHSGVLQDLLNHLGASAQFMTFADVYPALERGVLDAAVTCSTCGIGQKWYEVTSHLTGPFPGTFGQTFITFAKREWDKLPADIQAIIREAGEEYTKESEKIVLEWDAGALQELIDLGMIHQPFSPEMAATVRAAAVAAVVPNWATKAGGYESEAVQLYNEKVAPITGIYVLPDGTAEER